MTPQNANWAPQPASSPSNAAVNSQLPPGGGLIPPKTPQQSNAQAAAPQIPGQANRAVMPQQLPPRTSQTPSQQHPLTVAQVAQQGSPGVQNMSQAMATQQSGMQNGLQNGMQNGLHPTQANVAQMQLQMQMQMQQQRSNPFPALPLSAFDSAFKQWCSKQGVHVDPQHLALDDGKTVNLHLLHQEVITMGTIAKVRSRDRT